MSPTPNIIVANRFVPFGGLCVSPNDSGLMFTESNTCIKPREGPPDLLVWHNTAGRGSPKRVYKTLLRRRLSVHFAIGKDGIVYQFCDPAIYSCAHAGKGANSRSIGVEVVNLVLPPNPKMWRRLVYRLQGYSARLLDGRPSVVETYRGRKRQVIGHTPQQIEAAVALTKVLLNHFPGIPAMVPGGGAKPHGDRVGKGWSGVCGHLALTDRHVDPAQDLLFAIGQELTQ